MDVGRDEQSGTYLAAPMQLPAPNTGMSTAAGRGPGGSRVRVTAPPLVVILAGNDIKRAAGVAVKPAPGVVNATRLTKG